MWLYLQKPSLTAQVLESKTYTLALPRNTYTEHMAIDGQVCFHRWLIADPVKTPRYITGSVGHVNSQTASNTVLIYPVDWVSFCHFLKTQHYCLCSNQMEGITCLWLYTQPYHPPAPYNVPSVILQSLWKKCSKSSSVS